jgi:hypothetical protein
MAIRLEAGTWNFYDGTLRANPRLRVKAAGTPPGASSSYDYYNGDLDGLPMELQLDPNTRDVVMMVGPPGESHFAVISDIVTYTGSVVGNQDAMAGVFRPSTLDVVLAVSRGLLPPPLKYWSATLGVREIP